MSDKPKNPKQHSKSPLQKMAPTLTLEEQAKVLAEVLAAKAKAIEERQRVELYGKNVEKMSHRQLRGELRRLIRREHAGKPPEPQAGLNIALASVFLTVLNNTKTVVDKHTRRDQINPQGKLESYPR